MYIEDNTVAPLVQIDGYISNTVKPLIKDTVKPLIRNLDYLDGDSTYIFT